MHRRKAFLVGDIVHYSHALSWVARSENQFPYFLSESQVYFAALFCNLMRYDIT
jgi:hypothetical protein